MKKQPAIKSTQTRLTSTTELPSEHRWLIASRAGVASTVLAFCVACGTGTTVAEKIEDLNTEQEQLSYALGMAYGNQARKQSIELNLASFSQGLSDARSGSSTLLSEEKARELIAGLREELKQKQLALQAEKLKAENELAEKNRKEGEAFLAVNESKEGVISLESGLQYKILKAGTGDNPTADDVVVCHYKGTTLDGKEFDSTYVHGIPAAMPVQGVIQGWREALQLMPVGSKWRLFVPSQLAYGARAAGKAFGPNSTLIFEVELLSIQGKSAAQSAGQGTAADTAVTAAAK